MKLVDENGEISKHDLIIQVFEILLNPASGKHWFMIVINIQRQLSSQKSGFVIFQITLPPEPPFGMFIN